MGLDIRDIEKLIEILIIVPFTLFSIYYSVGVLYYDNIYQYAYRYITEIKYAVNGWELTWDNYIEHEVPQSEF